VDADDLRRLLRLEPLPVEGGWYVETYRSPHSTAIYYLLTPETFSAMHRLPADELYHFYLGDPVTMLLLDRAGGTTVTLGQDIAAGQRPQVVVPAGTWQGSLLEPGGRLALVGTTMAPGFEPGAREMGEREPLAAAFPAHRDLVARLTRA
jgi:predicted cupin superfamily sugar epimerase